MTPIQILKRVEVIAFNIATPTNQVDNAIYTHIRDFAYDCVAAREAIEGDSGEWALIPEQSRAAVYDLLEGASTGCMQWPVDNQEDFFEAVELLKEVKHEL